jgi:hypothetical protein
MSQQKDASTVTTSPSSNNTGTSSSNSSLYAYTYPSLAHTSGHYKVTELYVIYTHISECCSLLGTNPIEHEGNSGASISWNDTSRCLLERLFSDQRAEPHSDVC